MASYLRTIAKMLWAGRIMPRHEYLKLVIMSRSQDWLVDPKITFRIQAVSMQTETPDEAQRKCSRNRRHQNGTMDSNHPKLCIAYPKVAISGVFLVTLPESRDLDRQNLKCTKPPSPDGEHRALSAPSRAGQPGI